MYNKTGTFRDAELSPPINLQVVRPRRFAPVDISQGLIFGCKKQAFGDCDSDLSSLAFGIAFWQCVKYRWVGICF
jgi:hypothetical protein